MKVFDFGNVHDLEDIDIKCLLVRSIDDLAVKVLDAKEPVKQVNLYGIKVISNPNVPKDKIVVIEKEDTLWGMRNIARIILDM